ncbi:tautomerase family protein [Marinobacter sp. NFXS9]|uniref:tautomerase family protein n=1 Tax=Marinobacter sp. NFXS9 TaxID=2818433 RepID=UPI0032DFC2E3
MPMIQVNLLTGYSSALKDRLARALTSVIGGITRAKPDAITLWIHEIDPENYSRGGSPRLPGSGTTDPVMLVLGYLDAMQERNLETAQTYLAAPFAMTFPGSGELTSLGALVEWSKDRYRHIEKTVMATNVAYETDHIVVMVQGTLAGQWPDGRNFSGVRFIDRFELREDLIHRQDVWNDLANKKPPA